MTNQEMNEKINQIITDFLFPLNKHENSKEELAALSLLLRGFVTCDNDSIEKRPFLLTGINPSLDLTKENGSFFQEDTTNHSPFAALYLKTIGAKRGNNLAMISVRLWHIWIYSL